MRGCSNDGADHVAAAPLGRGGNRRVPADCADHLLAGAQGPDRAAWPHSARRRSLRSRAVPTKIEKDVVTGTNTTGHEWDGLKELNTPLPKWWLYVLYATIAWAAVWFVLYPSVPGITG